MATKQVTSKMLAHEMTDTLGRLVRRMRAESGPSVGRWAVLGQLDRGGPASISALAACEHMRPQSMAQTVQDLERSGLVSRRPDPADKRKVLIELTAAGSSLLRTTRARRESWLSGALDRELDDGERALLVEAMALLDRVAGA